MKKYFQGFLIALGGIMLGVKITAAILSKPLRRVQEDAIKFQAFFQMTSEWLKLKQKGINLSDYFELNKYRKIAIYGMGITGKLLYDELKEADVQVIYGIDKNNDSVLCEMQVYSPDDLLPDVDAIVVSVVTYYEEIVNLLQKRVGCAIISLEDLIYEMKEKYAN